MKKLLLTISASVMATTAFAASTIVEVERSSYIDSWMGVSGIERHTGKTTIAGKYNRENTISAADLKQMASGSATDYDSVLAAAKAEQAKAKKAGFEWNTIGKLMKAAAKDQKAGKTTAAVKKLKTAKEHAILGQKQAEVAKNAGPTF
jgi:hypothetical protein